MDFKQLANELLTKHNIQVIKEVNGSYGKAMWHSRNIIVPKSLGYLGFAILCHEIGHIVLGHCDKPKAKSRCLEEYEAWQFAKDTFNELGVPFKRRVAVRMKRSLAYAKRKAIRRGIKTVPKELKPY